MSTARVLQHKTQPQHRPDNTRYSPKFLEKQKSLQKQDKITSIALTAAIIAGLVFATAQLARGAFLNTDRYFTLNNKMSELNTLNKKANYENAVLKKNYKNYTSEEGVESLARDHLNLVRDNEISIIIKKS